MTPKVAHASSPSAPDHDEALDGLVVVRPSAELFDAPGGQLRARVAESGASLVGTMRALGRRGDWVEVATARFAGPACRRPWLPLMDFELRFWVRDEDLMPVVSRQTRVEFDDGSAMTVEPGTPVELVDGHVSGVWIGPELLAAPVPASAVATIFPQQQPPTTIERPLAMLPSDAETSLGGEPLPVALVDRLREGRIGPGLTGPRLPAPREQALVYAWRPETRIAELRMELQPRCASFEVRLAGASEPEALPAGVADTWPMGNLDWRVVFPLALQRSPWRKSAKGSVDLAEDVTIYWAEGGVAGRTIVATTIPSHGRVVEGRRCFELWLGYDTMLCVDQVDVVESLRAD